MKEEWKYKLQRSLTDYEQPAPDGLWEDIQKAMSASAGVMQDEGKVIPLPGKNRTKVVALRIAAAAACVACGVGLYLSMPDHDKGAHSMVADALGGGSKAAGCNGMQTDTPANGDGHGMMPQRRDAVGKLLAKADIPAAVREAISCSQAETKAEQLEYAPQVAVAAAAADNGNASIEKKSETQTDAVGAMRESVVRRGSNASSARYMNSSSNAVAVSHSAPEGRLTASLFAANAMGGSGNSITSDRSMFVMSDMMFNDYPELSDAYSAVNARTSGSSLNDESVDHHQPIRVGLSVHYSLSEKWGLETGLTYSYLYSETTAGKSDNRYDTKQKVHFLGIPLTVDYSIWRNKLLNVYVAGGGMVEKSLSAKATTSYVLNGRKMNTETNKLSMKELQWSVNAAAGIQLNITKEVGIYAEPGVGYYFDNGSDVKTAYSDNPFNFNMKLGLRYSIK